MAIVELPENVAVTRLDELVSWCRKNSLWPMPFATACCGIELMATGASRHDIARFGVIFALQLAQDVFNPHRRHRVDGDRELVEAENLRSLARAPGPA